jgi:hypothetical protein
VALQNDVFRRGVCGGVAAPAGFGQIPRGKMVMTAALAARSPEFLASVLRAVTAHDQFDPENDPDETHDFGSVEIEGESVWFKVDLFDLNYQYAAPDPADLARTARVLTLLFPADW